MNRYEQTKNFIVDKLKAGLPETLYYHGFHHVMDVLSSAEMLGEMEKISPMEMELLRIAVLFHDSGFTIHSKDHETLSCGIARENLPLFGYSEKDIETICGMIMATKYPQQPKNLLEEIICDADLDYLGRDDFFEIANTLFKELSTYGIVASEKDWYKLQENFLNSHHYFTKSAINLRDDKKKKHLEKIKKIIIER